MTKSSKRYFVLLGLGLMIVYLAFQFSFPKSPKVVSSAHIELLNKLDLLVIEIGKAESEEAARPKILVFNSLLQELDRQTETADWHSRGERMAKLYSNSSLLSPSNVGETTFKLLNGIKDEDVRWYVTYRAYRDLLKGISDSTFQTRAHLFNAQGWYPSFKDLLD